MPDKESAKLSGEESSANGEGKIQREFPDIMGVMELGEAPESDWWYDKERDWWLDNEAERGE